MPYWYGIAERFGEMVRIPNNGGMIEITFWYACRPSERPYRVDIKRWERPNTFWARQIYSESFYHHEPQPTMVWVLKQFKALNYHPTPRVKRLLSITYSDIFFPPGAPLTIGEYQGRRYQFKGQPVWSSWIGRDNRAFVNVFFPSSRDREKLRNTLLHAKATRSYITIHCDNKQYRVISFIRHNEQFVCVPQ